MSLAQQDRACSLDRNQLKVPVFKLNVANRAVRAQRAHGLSVSANGQAARIASAQKRGLVNIHGLDLAWLDHTREQSGSVTGANRYPGGLRGEQFHARGSRSRRRGWLSDGCRRRLSLDWGIWRRRGGG